MDRDKREDQGYDEILPSYDDAVKDLPPDYDTLSPFAQRKDLIHESAPPKYTRYASPKPSPHAIDFDSSFGIREYKGGKKKKKSAAAPQRQASPPPNDDDKKDEGADEGANGGDAPAGGGESGDGNGDGGDDGGGGDEGGDDWGAWNTTSSKKKDKKKKKEEEEQAAKEEEERKAKEEEEQKAAEAAAADNHNLSWADDPEGNGDESWAGFTTAGKKKKKGKVLCIKKPPVGSVELTFYRERIC